MLNIYQLNILSNLLFYTDSKSKRYLVFFSQCFFIIIHQISLEIIKYKNQVRNNNTCSKSVDNILNQEGRPIENSTGFEAAAKTNLVLLEKTILYF